MEPDSVEIENPATLPSSESPGRASFPVRQVIPCRGRPGRIFVAGCEAPTVEPDEGGHLSLTEPRSRRRSKNQSGRSSASWEDGDGARSACRAAGIPCRDGNRLLPLPPEVSALPGNPARSAAAGAGDAVNLARVPAIDARQERAGKPRGDGTAESGTLRCLHRIVAGQQRQSSSPLGGALAWGIRSTRANRGRWASRDGPLRHPGYCGRRRGSPPGRVGAYRRLDRWMLFHLLPANASAGYLNPEADKTT